MTDNELTMTYIDGLMRGREEAAEQLAAAQEREAQLRESLDVIEKGACLLNMPRIEMQTVARAVLALPHDDTALRARLKAERKRCAATCEQKHINGNWMHDTRHECAEAIRNLGDE